MDVHHQIRDIFEAAVDLPKERRSAFVRDRCGHDTAIYDEVARLVEAYEDGVERIEDPLPGASHGVGGRQSSFGSYEIIRELGRGGMGAVYLGRRTDGAFERQVAIKVVRTDRLAGGALERFARERRLLAKVAHPGIATLFDAGSTDDGMPYFVMEYVDGLPVTTYCDQHQLDIRRRVVLFQRICDAVACAHRVPIVHCDLKPANILVDGDGAPRVLDFGIATALTRDGHEVEPALEAYGSPRYASPEQLRGLPVQTTSDIYSLGVVLHELLVGQAPVQPATRPGAEADVIPSSLFEAGEETGARLDQPTRIAAQRSTTVGALRAVLEGDLDAIVARCLLQVPELRYQTVDALRDDLQAWLERRPVSARPRTLGYVMWRFVDRHRALVAASVAAVALILAGIAGVIYQWRAAEHARLLAERRFEDVRGLATSLFDVDTALADLAGATEARRTIVENASQYLDRLGQDVIGDPSLLMEMAESYRRVGDMLGNPNVPNLGQRTQALQKYEVATKHLAAAAALRPQDPAVRAAEARVLASTGDVLLAQQALPEARQVYERSVSILQSELDRDGDSIVLRQALAGVYRPLGEVVLAGGHPEEALKIFERARTLDLAVLDRTPASPPAQRLLALSQLRVAEALAATGKKNDAIEAYGEASRLLGALSAREPAQARLARDIAVSRMKLARLIRPDGDGRARLELQQALETFRELARLDPRNAGAQRDLLVALVAVGDLDASIDAARSHKSYVEAQRLAERLQAEPFEDPQAARDLRIVRERLSAQAGPTTIPELKVAVLRDGVELSLDKYARPPAVGDELRVSWTSRRGETDYVLVLGGQGRASLLTRDELASTGWHLIANGPPPSQTLLLLTSSHALAPSEREALLDRVSSIPGLRHLPPDAHILWRSHRQEVIDATATARGVTDTDWTRQVREELERLSGVRFSGRTFPLAAR